MSEGTTREGLERSIAEEAASLGVPGAAIGIVHGDDEYTRSFGVTNVDHPLPVDETTAFMIGSITKTLTATAVMALVESVKTDLDVPVRQYIPDLELASEETAASVTLRHLLTHTAGWEGESVDDHGP